MNLKNHYSFPISYSPTFQGKVLSQISQIYWLFFLLFPKKNLVVVEQIKLKSTLEGLNIQGFQNTWVRHLDSSFQTFVHWFLQVCI